MPTGVAIMETPRWNIWKGTLVRREAEEFERCQQNKKLGATTLPAFCFVRAWCLLTAGKADIVDPEIGVPSVIGVSIMIPKPKVTIGFASMTADWKEQLKFFTFSSS